jgi:hypothetical protein
MCRSPAVCVEQSNGHYVKNDLVEQQYKAAGVLECFQPSAEHLRALTLNHFLQKRVCVLRYLLDVVIVPYSILYLGQSYTYLKLAMTITSGHYFSPEGKALNNQYIQHFPLPFPQKNLARPRESRWP